MSGRHAVVNSLTFHLRRLAAVLFCATVLLGCALAEDGVTVPHLVKFSGTISGAPAGNVSVIFALYKDQSGGAPLWQEVQNLAVDSGGHYNSLLGLRSATGIPLEVFSTGEARWLGVEAEGQPEQPRVLLVSVPYALKASDSETLGGLPVSAFLRAGAAPVAAPAPANFINTAAVTAAVNNAVTAAISASGPTLGYVPYFYDASGDLKNSSLFQATSGNVGIGTTTPAAMFTIVGTNPSIRLENYSNVSGDSPNFNFYTGRGSANAPLATQSGDNLGQFASAGYNGSAFPGSKVKVGFMSTENWTATANGTAMAFATTTNGTTTRTERMRVDNTGNIGIGTSTPAYPLSVAGVIQSTSGGFKFPDGTTQATAGLSGTVAIANGGTGATTQQLALNALIGSQVPNTYLRSNGTNSYLSAIQALDVPTLPNVAYTNSANTFAQSASFGGQVSASSSTGLGAVVGNGTSGVNGVAGYSDTRSGVFGNATNPTNGGAGVLGSTLSAFSRTYTSESSVAAAGVWGDTSGNNNGLPAGVIGTADTGYAGVFVNNSASAPAVFVTNSGGGGLSATGEGGDGINGTSSSGGNGVYGVAYSLVEQEAGVLGVGNAKSTTFSSYNIYSGVWGDTGTSSTAVSPAWAVGVIGTSDDGHAGVFLNNSNSWTTMYLGNSGTAGTSVVPGLFTTLQASTRTGTCGIGGNGDLTCTGQVKTLATAGGGARTVETYAMQSPENWMEDFGSAALEHGVAVVNIDPGFAETVSGTAGYYVFLTPNGDSRGLYISRKTAATFEVRESGGGTSSLSFDYRIVAKRRGYDGQRLADVTERFNAEQKGLSRSLKVRETAAHERPATSPLVPRTHRAPTSIPMPGRQHNVAKPLAPATRP